MDESKHTPGPWYVGINESVIDSPAGEKFLGIGTDGERTICRVSQLATQDAEDEANAQLIAAAPDLLIACQRALNWIELHAGEDWGKKIQERMRNAIAKAEGTDNTSSEEL
jgi:hypothetical protein